MTRRQSQLAVALAALAASALMSASTASAATVELIQSSNSYVADEVVYAAAPGEVNTVELARDSLEYSSWLRITDSTAPLTAATGCEQLSAHEARCPLTVFSWPDGQREARVNFSADLEDQNDQLVSSVAVQQAGGLDYTSLNVTAGDGDDLIAAVAGENNFKLGPGNDTAQGGLSGDRIIGGPGSDSIRSGPSRPGCIDCQGDHLIGGPEDDRLDARPSRSHDIFLDGGGGGDTLLGSRRAPSRLFGRGGPDTLFGGTAIDDLVGGPGRDVLHGGRGHDFERQ